MFTLLVLILLARSFIKSSGLLDWMYSFMDEPIGDWTMSEVGALLVCVTFWLLCVLGLAILIRWIVAAKNDTKNSKLPLQEIRARIIRIEGNAFSDYYCTFEFEDGQRRKIRIPAISWKEYVEGDVGVLTIQGTEFRRFILDKKAF